MITLTATINLIDEDKGQINSATSNVSRNNISKEIGAIVGSRKQGSNPFIIGASKVGEKTAYLNSVDYYIGKQLSNSLGAFTTPYEIVVSGNNIQAITIIFDTYNNQYPNKIEIDGVEHQDDDPVFTINNLEKANSHTIRISNWNTPNYPLRVQGIYVTLSLEIDNRSLISLERTLFDRANINKPSWGVISNSARMTFNDLDNEIKDYVAEQLLQAGLSTKFYINNTISGDKELVGVYKTSNWEYDEYNKVVTLDLKDDLEEWQDIIIPGIGYNPNIDKPITFAVLYEFLYNKTPDKYNMMSYYGLDDHTQYILDYTYIKFPILNRGTLWAGWTKLCEVCQFQIYKDQTGTTVCKYNGGI